MGIRAIFTVACLFLALYIPENLGYNLERVKRDAIDKSKLEEYLKSHLSWLTEDQKSTIKSMADKDFKDIQNKVFEFYDALSGEAKTKARNEMQEGCRTLIKELVGEEKANELKKMREDKKPASEIEKKVVEFMDTITDEDKKQRAVKYTPACKRIFELEGTARVKRSNVDAEKFEEALKTHLAWLSEDQKEKVRTMKNDGKSFEDIQKQVFEYFEGLSGDTKNKAKEMMQEGCRKVIKELVGEEKANELKKMREGGSSKKEIQDKIVQLMEGLSDEKKKETAVKYAQGCQKIFDIKDSRVKRDVDKAKFDQYLKTHLSWLNDGQKTELKSMSDSGKDFKDIHDKVFEFYDKLSGDAKNTAREQMQGGCRELIKELVGEDKANELKKLRESGAAASEIEKKVAAFMDELTDEDKKQKAVKYAPACKRIFDLKAARVKRDTIDKAKLEEYLKSHLSWLTDDQKSTIKSMSDKPFKEIQDKVFEFYDALSGDAKTKARNEMQEGCRTLIKELVGEEKANELKKMREDKKPASEIEKKVVEFMDTITDEDKKQRAVKYTPACKRIFELEGTARVKRSDVDSAKFEESLKTHLSWLTEDQKTEVRKLKDAGKSFEDIQAKVFEYYKALSGDAKDKATTLLQTGCRELIKSLVGEEKANELKKMREDGSSKADIKAKIIELMDGLTDENKKQMAVKYAGGCQKVFEIDA